MFVHVFGSGLVLRFVLCQVLVGGWVCVIVVVEAAM